MVLNMRPAFTPSEATRKTCRRILAKSIITDQAPAATIVEMCTTAIENDFKTPDHPTAEHAMTQREHEAVMTWAVSFMGAFCSAMDSYFSGRWTPTPRDD